MEVLKKGTIEPLLVALRDRLANVDNLGLVSNLQFYVHAKSDDSSVQPDTAVQLDGDFLMTAICLIDTSLVAYVGEAEYKLYLKYDYGVEHPVLGPIFFRVEDD